MKENKKHKNDPHRKDPEEQKGKIIDCVLKGYVLNDKVIRHPKVVVGK